MKTIKVIKVIDLINLIANEDEIPKRIKIRGNIFEWKVTENGTGYCNVEKYKGYDWLENYISLDNRDDLNTNVEIIEENKSIEKIKITFTTFDIRDKVNEIIDVINEIKENKEEK